jgi:hypothetical protein
MSTQIQIVIHEEIDETFSTQIQRWTKEVLDKAEFPTVLPHLCLMIWKTMEKFHAFYSKEKEELGVVTGEEADFLATHDAWRGYPRIHICQERVKGIPSAVVQGTMHHEIGHAFHHGRPDFYTFRFSNSLQQAGQSHGLNLVLLQQCVYFLSIAIKDQEVVQWLAKIGLGFGQLALLGYLLSDTEEEHQAWELARDSHGLRKIALAAFLKTLLPIEAMISVGIPEAKILRKQWDEAYGWLSEKEREGLSLFALSITNVEAKTFQERLEHAASRLISETSL